MPVFLKASVLVMLFLTTSLAKAEEIALVSSAKETLPPAPVLPAEDLKAITLDEATKQVMQDANIKVLAAKTEMIAGKKIHVIKILTSAGHIQYIKIDAATGKPLDKSKK